MTSRLFLFCFQPFLLIGIPSPQAAASSNKDMKSSKDSAVEVEEVELQEVTPEMLAEQEKAEEKSQKEAYEADEEVRKIQPRTIDRERSFCSSVEFIIIIIHPYTASSSRK